MKRLFGLLITLTIFYLLIQLGFKYFDQGHTVKYSVGKDQSVSIKEIFSQNQKGEKDNYFFEFSVNKESFYYQTYHNFNKLDRVISDIKYISKDGISCIVPIFKKGYTMDMLCKKGTTQYFYRDLVGQSPEIDAFVASLKEEKIAFPSYSSNFENESTVASIQFYPNQIPQEHIISVEGYKGIYTFTNSRKNNSSSSELFSHDVYKRSISGYVQNYYVTADYNQEYSFHEFLVVNLTTMDSFKIMSNDSLSLDGYMQGSVDDSIYYVDRNTKKQYKITPKKKTITEIGNVDLGGKVYQNKTWKESGIYNLATDTVSTKEYRIENPFSNINYSFVDQVGNQKSGFYYAYSSAKGYDVYRIDVQNTTNRTYLFHMNDLNHITYIDDYLYFIMGNTLYYYSDNTGLQKVLTNSEFEFNPDIKIGITKK